MRRLAACALMLMLAAAAVPTARVEARSVPPRFFGVMANGPLDLPSVDLGAEEALMRSSGVETIRLPVRWPELQPFRHLDDVPGVDRPRYTVIEGVPTDFSTLDRRVEAAARNDLDVLALVLESPAWAAATSFTPPRANADYQRVLRALIGRYGPAGSFWAANPSIPRHPIRNWQVWNEPSVRQYFDVPSFAKPYVRLLASAYSAVKGTDRGATVIAAGLPNFSWRDAETLYAAGLRARGHFDALAVHPFTGRPADSVTILRRVRAVLDRHGDQSAHLWVTEVSWPSARGKVSSAQRWVTTEAGQAARLREAYLAYAKARQSLRLDRVYWYSWATVDRDSPNSFDYAGLRTYTRAGDFADKPALAAYAAVSRALSR